MTEAPALPPRGVNAVNDQAWTTYPYCSTLAQVSSLVNLMQHPPVDFDADEFCSYNLQSVTYVPTTTTITGPVTRTSITITVTSTTTTDTFSRTSTLLCPIPSPTMNCGISGTFTSEFLEKRIILHSNPYVASGTRCHQVCLEHRDCKSFVTYDSTRDGSTCDLYNATLAEGILTHGDVDNANHWFDRDCPNLLPPGCSKSPSSPKITGAPALMKGREVTVTTPDFLKTLNPLLPYIACSCIITSLGPTRTSTYIVTNDLQSYTTTRTTSTTVAVSTSVPHLTTSYTFIP
ncbi:hypothetical protein B0J14DRAFT_568313 [Halenospora varia]|nr:hypothetical protein B0J14DRAFT_568313 [Halenospora varia]